MGDHLPEISDPSPAEKFERLVKRPIQELKKLPDGDGCFSALSICFGLYERFIHSLLHKKHGMRADPPTFVNAASEDLGCDSEAFRRFWNGYRLGMQHAFQPKQYIEKKGRGDRWGWDMAEAEEYKGFPEIVEKEKGLYIVRIDPWKFVEHVLERWEKHHELYGELTEFAFGKIMHLKSKEKRTGFEERSSSSQYSTYSPPMRDVPATGSFPFPNDGSTGL